MRAAWVVKIYHIEFRLHLIPVQMVQQVVVSNRREVGEFEIVNIHRVPFFNLLLDVGIDHCETFPAAGRAQHDGRTLRQKNIDPAVVPPLAVIKARAQVHRIFVREQARFLLERFVLVVERIVHQIVLQKAAHPQATHQQADITRRHRCV